MSDSRNSTQPPPAPAGQAVEPAAGDRLHVCGATLDELGALLAGLGEPRYRADQVADWVFAKGVTSFDEMTNLSKALRALLSERCVVRTAELTRTAVAADATRKLLLTFRDGAAVETVWIPEGERHTVCLSSQVGCPVGCRFCASGLDGLQRNLTAGEIVEQALHVRACLRAALDDASARLTNVVLMGMGEPLANYAQVVKAIRILNAPWGLGIGARRITVSTVGLPGRIRRLAGEDLQVNLALSLHAPTEALRRKLIPWARTRLKEVLDACEAYFRRTGREVTLEYVLLAGVNDQREHARQLAVLARRLRANVNLLRYNPVPGLPYRRPGSADAFAFQRWLREAGVNAHVRRSRGGDISAACGQLRRASRSSPA